MNVINVPFVRHEDDEKCYLLNANTNRYPPVQDVVDELVKVMTLMPEVKNRIKLKLESGALA